VCRAVIAAFIENPILNSACAESMRHFRFEDGGDTDKAFESRKPSILRPDFPQLGDGA